MTTDIIIRDLRPDDVEAIADIAVAAWAPIYQHYRAEMGDDLFDALHPDWRAEKAAQIRHACVPSQDQRAIVLVAEEEGRPIGFLTFYVDETTRVGVLGNNAVRPSERGRGIAPQLYEEAFGRMRSLGMRYVRVRTGLDPAHAPARRAYQKAGFDVALPSVDYYRAL